MINLLRFGLAILLFYGAALPAAHAQFKENIGRYYDYFNASTRAEHEGKLDSAIYYVRMAIKADPNNNLPYRFLSDLLIRKGNYKEAVSLREADILMGSTPPEKFEYLFQHYDSVKSRPEIIQFQKRIPGLVKTYYSTSYNHAFASMIYTMLGRDQAVRGTMYKMFAGDSIKSAAAFRIQNYLDTAVNLPQLVTYLKEHGFPAHGEMDDDVRFYFQGIIHHLIAGNEGSAIDTLHQLIQTAIYEGKYSGYAYMLALDWGAINRTGKQIYGTYIGPGPDGETTFWPAIEDVASVDARRAKWKQEPLKEVPFSDWRNPKLPADYKP